MINEDYFNGLHISTIRAFGNNVAGNNVAVNNTVIVYTVPANYELLLTEWWHSSFFGANGIGDLAVYTAGPALSYYLNRQPGFANTSINTVKNVIPPHVLAAGYSIRLVSNVATLNSYGGITGYTYPIA